MYSVMVGCSPQTGQSGLRLIFTSLNSVASASKQEQPADQRLADAGASLIASFVCSVPTMPGSTPSTPPSAHDGASSGGGGEG